LGQGSSAQVREHSYRYRCRYR